MSKKTRNIIDPQLKAEALELDNVVISNTRHDDNCVYVFANLPTSQTFVLEDGLRVTVAGLPVSDLHKPGGGFFAGGKYGVTKVDKAACERVLARYGRMRMFESGLVFAAPSLETGRAMSRERGGLRHGFEPVDPESPKAKSRPAKAADAQE